MKENADEFLEASRLLIGKDAVDSRLSNTIADLATIAGYSTALGNDNPLFVDPEYAAKRRYGCVVAPLTFFAAVRYPMSSGAFSKKDYGLADFLDTVMFERYDVVRVGAKLSADVRLTSVEGEEIGEKRVALLTSEGSYLDQCGTLVGEAKSTMRMVPFKRGEEMFVTRDIHKYTDEEIKRVEDDLDSETMRGGDTLYWGDVNVGDKLTPVVKGPLSLIEIANWRSATRVNEWSLEIVYREAKANPGLRRVNPVTCWPYWHTDLEDQSYHTCVLRGISLPFAPGLLQACLAEHLLTNWIGDDGFLKMLRMQVRMPFIYGDVNWYRGIVRDKYKEKRGGELYGAVEVGIEALNQLGEVAALGDAVAYLPSVQHEVVLPIPRGISKV